MFRQVVFFLGFLKLCATAGMPSCMYPPCRYNVIRQAEDMSGIVVTDNSNHSISWSWSVQGGRWNVLYKYNYPSGWYEGQAVFNKANGQNPAIVSWGSSKNWESNAVPVFANAWNVSYNGDIFGFVPSGGGRYIFRIYTKNRRHNPFGDDIVNPPAMCTLRSTDRTEMSRWWAQRKAQRNCLESTINWAWSTNRGRWRVVYKWASDTDRTTCSVSYRSFSMGEEMEVINWVLDVPKKTVIYKTNPMRIMGENAWQLTLSPTESWGFTPNGNGQWIFQHFSRDLVFRPFNSFRGTMSIA